MKMTHSCAIVGQSGGPTGVINATLFGVIDSCRRSGKIDKLYGMRNGIEGFLKEDFVDLFSFFDSSESASELKYTPGSALGSCRMKLPDFEADTATYQRIFSILERYEIEYFFYIGGNDSMDTVSKLSRYADKNGGGTRFVGIPKTIDNDLEYTHHTPGYGSASKLVVTAISEILRDSAVYTQNSVTVVEIMGRDSGWLTASSGLCGINGGKGVDLIYLPEIVFDETNFIRSVKKSLSTHPNVVVAVSEGIKYSNGKYVSESSVVDSFGHSMLCGASRVLADLVRNSIGCKARAVELGVLQRCSAHLLSGVDVYESELIGNESVNFALSGKSGIMSALEYENKTLKITTVDATRVAGKVKRVPRDFINENGNGITDKCIDYALPLIQGEVGSRFENGMPKHITI